MTLTDDVWEISPKRGIGPIELSMTKDDCIRILGEPDRQFRMWPHRDDIDCVSFRTHFTFVLVNRENVVVDIAVACPRQVRLQNVMVLGRSLHDTIADLERVGVRVENADIGVKCPDIGIALIESEGRVLTVDMADDRFW